jgi:GH24 family phage-related lysozyme (muramidase)
MKTSTSQLNKIASREGFKAKAYRDGSAGGIDKYSIGYGHQIGLSEHALMTTTITQSSALKLLQSDVLPLEIQINNALAAVPSFKATQNQFDAWVDFGFNCGSGSLSKVLGTFKANPHNLKAVTDEMALYNKTHDNTTNALVTSSELTSRRAAEISLFNSPYTPAITGALALGVAVVAYLAFT